MSYYKSAEEIYDEMFNDYTATSTLTGSLIYNACMPVCMKLSEAFLDLDEVTKKIFAKSATESGYSSSLELRVGEMGIERKEATYAEVEITVKGTPKYTFKKDSIVSTTDNRLYITENDLILDENGNGKVTVRAEKTGSKYNVNTSEINYLPIKYNGIVSIVNEKSYFDAYDTETDEELYQRYCLKVQTPATSGNKWHYVNWALEVNGVGSAKVYPLWAGNGTVKVVISNSNERAASQELVQAVKNYIDPNDEDGSGVAPIGATLTVISVQEKAISVTANVQISTSVTLNDVQNNFIKALESYFKDTFNSTKVSIMKIGSLLFDINGVLDVDYESIKLNGAASNITLGADEIAVLSSSPVSLGVMS